ncbi:hypothetical protein AWN76_006050 [Rhodothermaceae bacterium RA]|nr:hypothetical protein AWN76_006050 [Rhodothermaceae bacterium RA]
MPFEFAWSDPTVQRILLTLVVLLVAVLIVRIGRRLVPRYTDDPARQYRASRLISRTTALLALVLILALWSPRGGDLLQILTIMGAGLAIAMREVLLGLIGWTHLVFRGTYRRGDRIEVNGVRGDVVDIRLQHTILMEVGGWVDADQSSGRLLHIPNGWVYQYAVLNYNHGFNFIWNEIALTVTFRSDWEAAQEIMLAPARQAAQIVEQQAAREIRDLSREFLVHYSILSPFVYVRIVENGIRLTLRYLCDVRKRRGTEHALTMSILRGFKEHGGIELAYPMVGVSPMEPPQFGPIPGAPPPAEEPPQPNPDLDMVRPIRTRPRKNKKRKAPPKPSPPAADPGPNDTNPDEGPADEGAEHRPPGAST